MVEGEQNKCGLSVVLKIEPSIEPTLVTTDDEQHILYVGNQKGYLIESDTHFLELMNQIGHSSDSSGFGEISSVRNKLIFTTNLFFWGLTLLAYLCQPEDRFLSLTILAGCTTLLLGKYLRRRWVSIFLVQADAHLTEVHCVYAKTKTRRFADLSLTSRRFLMGVSSIVAILALITLGADFLSAPSFDGFPALFLLGLLTWLIGSTLFKLARES